MSIRLFIAAAFMLSVTCGVSSVSVAVDFADTSAIVDNTTFVDNSEQSLKVSDGGIRKIQGVIDIAKLGPMCQCLCTNVTDVDVQIKSVSRLNSFPDNALKGGDSHFFEVRTVRQESSVNISDVNTTAHSGTQSGNSTDETSKGKDSNVTFPDPIALHDVDVELVNVDADVSDFSVFNSTVNSTGDLSSPTSMEERVFDDQKLDEEALGTDVDISNITTIVLDFVFETLPNISQPDVSSLVVDRELAQEFDGFNGTGFEEADMDLEDFVLLESESDEATANTNSTATVDLVGFEIESEE